MLLLLLSQWWREITPSASVTTHIMPGLARRVPILGLSSRGATAGITRNTIGGIRGL